MSLKRSRSEARTINGLTRFDIVRIAQQDKHQRARLLLDSIKMASTIGTIGESLPADVTGSKPGRDASCHR